MTFQSFDSFEEMQAAMAEAEAAAIARICPTQAAITYGDCWMRYHADVGLIFGRVQTHDEHIAWCNEHGVDPEERDAEWAGVVEQRERGYVYGMARSAPFPEGELGSTHVSEIWPIPMALYVVAGLADWSVDAMDLSVRQQLATIMQAAIEEQRGHHANTH